MVLADLSASQNKLQSERYGTIYWSLEESAFFLPLLWNAKNSGGSGAIAARRMQEVLFLNVLSIHRSSHVLCCRCHAIDSLYVTKCLRSLSRHVKYVGTSMLKFSAWFQVVSSWCLQSVKVFRFLDVSLTLPKPLQSSNSIRLWQKVGLPQHRHHNAMWIKRRGDAQLFQ